MKKRILCILLVLAINVSLLSITAAAADSIVSEPEEGDADVVTETEDNHETKNSDGTQDNSDAGENSGTEDNSEVEDNSGTEDNSEVEDNSGIEDNSDAEDNSGTEDNSDAEENGDTEDNSNTEDNSGTEDNSDTEENGNTEDNRDAEDNSGTEDNRDAEDNSGTEDNSDEEENSGEAENHHTSHAESSASSTAAVDTPAVSHTITIAELEHGTITADPESAEEGTEVTLTVEVRGIYGVDMLTVTDENGEEMSLTDHWDGTYTFTMPDSEVSVDCTFYIAIPEDPDAGLYFWDIDPADYFYRAVQWAFAKGFTSGTSETTFSPHAQSTRAQTVMLLWRVAGSPQPTGTETPFADVLPGSYYYDAVLWAVEQGLIPETDRATFDPDSPMTRAQTVALLYQEAGKPAANAERFADVEEDSEYAAAVSWASEREITSGTGDNSFTPTANCTRAQTIMFLFKKMLQ